VSDYSPFYSLTVTRGALNSGKRYRRTASACTGNLAGKLPVLSSTETERTKAILAELKRDKQNKYCYKKNPKIDRLWNREKAEIKKAEMEVDKKN